MNSIYTCRTRKAYICLLSSSQSIGITILEFAKKVLAFLPVSILVNPFFRCHLLLCFSHCKYTFHSFSAFRIAAIDIGSSIFEFAKKVLAFLPVFFFLDTFTLSAACLLRAAIERRAFLEVSRERQIFLPIFLFLSPFCRSKLLALLSHS